MDSTIPSITMPVRTRVAVLGTGRICREWLRLCLSHPYIDVCGVFSLDSTFDTVQPLRDDYFPELQTGLQLRPFLEVEAASCDVIVLTEPALNLSESVSTLLTDMRNAGKRFLDLSTMITMSDMSEAGNTEKSVIVLPEDGALRHTLSDASVLKSLPVAVYVAYLLIQPLLLQGVPAKGAMNLALNFSDDFASSAQGMSIQYNTYLHNVLSGHCTIDWHWKPNSDLLNHTRGMLSRLTFSLPDGYAGGDIMSAYRQSYSDSPFIRIVHPSHNPHHRPDTRFVLGSNLLDISFHLDYDSGETVVLAACDVYGKASIGTMMQAFNIAMGWEEDTGLSVMGLLL